MNSTRELYSFGAIGPPIATLQTGLGISADGDFGRRTESAVRAWQVLHGAADTGVVTAGQWSAITQHAVPSLFARCLNLTAAFEGHSFTKAVGDFDGAGITWGVIGFTLKSGSLVDVLKRVPVETIAQCFGGENARLISNLPGYDWTARQWWAREYALKENGELRSEWIEGFDKLGRTNEGVVTQIVVAKEAYWRSAVRAAERLGVASETGHALLFDVQVQQGGLKMLPQRINSESEMLARIVEASVKQAAKQWRDDVMNRKTTIAAGQGKVHGRDYKLAAWGLQAVTAEDIAA